MSTPPNEKGIMDAMKSMKNIAGGTVGATTSFPRPPIDFVGTTTETKKKNTTAKKKSAKVLKTKKSAGLTTKAKPISSPPPPPSSATIPQGLPPKPDANSQLFGTLLNSLKTCPADQLDSVKRNKTEKNIAKSGNKSKTKKKGYASSSSSSSVPSVSTSSNNSSSMSSMSSRTSSPSDMVSSISSGSTQSYSTNKPGKVAREKKKRQEELLHEKVELLTRITNLSKNGFTATKQWDVKDDIDEIRYECYRMQRESNSKKSIKIMRRVLVTITTLVETGNAYFNPFNLRLDGFSESMMLNLDDYDDCFEQIHHKYSGRSSVGPEMQILFTFMSAAIFHHAGNAIGGGRGGGSSEKKKSSASPMSSVMSMMGMLSNNKNQSSTNNYPIPRTTPPPTSTAKEDSAEKDSEAKPKRKTMRGPGASSIPASIFGNSQTTPSMTLPV